MSFIRGLTQFVSMMPIDLPFSDILVNPRLLLFYIALLRPNSLQTIRTREMLLVISSSYKFERYPRIPRISPPFRMTSYSRSFQDHGSTTDREERRGAEWRREARRGTQALDQRIIVCQTRRPRTKIKVASISNEHTSPRVMDERPRPLALLLSLLSMNLCTILSV